ncbi:MAG: leucine-rich repeat domain-containing protein [Verrucomicrobia bacterium]|nr:leucine-rich repeat domain-containing protein [Verrucomicrobiota bacterium]MDA1086452.1 leucine-rich repeat domain-containing protein [Verrucomicrobiota bacterium]
MKVNNRRSFASIMILALVLLVPPAIADISATVSLNEDEAKTAGAAPVAFTDSKLEFYVRSVTGRRRPAELRRSDLERIEEIDLAGLGIRSIEGIGLLVGLKQITLVSNMVSRLDDVAKLRNLEVLDLRHNRVGSIDALRNLEQIKVLLLDHNLVQDLSPLVENTGIGTGDRISLNDNDLDCEKAKQPLEALRGRGADVASDCE